ncbi:flagellar biosynthetic protein FliO [Peribacillus deserti]|uniref:Flagellar biosynthesis protein FliZ n=1 Tax=Peribacillus deserti TaxID=673318 RepID=A0A2N5MB17_9BACI|nr:flagellar biosynthetic protein FliO [Peribacillus deserti]PLT31558.1 flagellar biosynthesis protein FliZ [Peribacillus deserti]
MVIKKVIGILLLLSLMFYGTGNHVDAKQVEKSVKDWYEHPDKSKETADQNQEPASTKGTDGADFSAGDFFRMISATIFVVALLYFMLRFMNKKNRSYQKANFVENLGGTSLGGNRSVQLVKVGERVLVVGVGDNIQLLKEISEEHEYKTLIQEHNKKLDGMLQPSDLLSKWKQRGKEQSSENRFTGQLKKQLEELSTSRKKAIDELRSKGGTEDE